MVRYHRRQNPNCRKCGSPIEPEQKLLCAIYGKIADKCLTCYEKDEKEVNPPIRVFLLNDKTDLGKLAETIKMFVGE